MKGKGGLVPPLGECSDRSLARLIVPLALELVGDAVARGGMAGNARLRGENSLTKGSLGSVMDCEADLLMGQGHTR